MDKLAESFQQHLTVEGIFTMVVNIAIILAIIHYVIIPLAREIRKETAPKGIAVTTAAFSEQGTQSISSEYSTE